VLWGCLKIGAQLVAAPGHYLPDEREAFRRMRSGLCAPAVPTLRDVT
jgi:hypothetical protein